FSTSPYPTSHCLSQHWFFPQPLPPAPSPALFPYTTLFRSRARLEELLRDRPAEAPAGPCHQDRLPLHAHRSAPVVRGQPGLRPGDRKSTRLNSSHQIISYAVFCLEKKK